MFETVIALICVVIALIAFPAGYWLFRREHELRRALREAEPDLPEDEIRRRVRRIMNGG